MQEDDKETSESQPQPEEQPPSQSAADESPPKPEEQSPSQSAADESQPQPEGRPPPATPIPLPPTQRRKRWQYILGLVFGLIPVIFFLVGYGIDLGSRVYLSGIGPFFLGLLLYVIELIVTIAFLSNKDRRF